MIYDLSFSVYLFAYMLKNNSWIETIMSENKSGRLR
jgi:hypothetical protein